jgi:ribose transport system ATP-binding protein
LGSEGARHPFARLDHKAETEQAKAFLARLGIDIDVEQHVRSFPVAVQQMVEIGKALMQNPRLVIFDEPTAMLGAFEKQKFFDVLRTLRREGVASVLITHHIEDVMDVSDRVSIMRNGKLVDSFAMDRGIDAELVLARLIGKKSQAATVRLNPFREEKFLQIENGVQANGARISMSARRGEIIGLYGVVGCGPERIAHGLAGLADVRPWSFVIDGVTFKPRNPVEALRVGVAYLPAGRASNSIFPSRSIRENLNLAQLSRFSKFGLVSHRAERTATEELLRLFRVKYNHADDLITSLSGGNQQKVVLARVIARAEKLLVLEEPTAGIDIETKYEIHERIRELAGKGVTVILVSSDLIETITLCDSVFTMYSGGVVRKYTYPQLEDQAAIISDVLGQKAIQQPQTEVLDS